MPRFPPDSLVNFAARVLQSSGADDDEARTVAESLVLADLSGYASHGLMRLPFYVEMVHAGDIVPGAALEVLQEGAARLAADAGWGFGRVQCGRLMDRLGKMAVAEGVAVGTLRNCSHIGRLGEYCELAAEQGLTSLLMANTHGAAHRVAPPGGVQPRLGTNPMALGSPSAKGPVVLDFSTSATAEGKVRVHKIAGKPCPDGWLLDSQGRPTNDPESLYADPPGTILPMGGEQTYKGFGLALMIDIFCGALSGGLCAREKPITPKGNCVFAMVLCPDRFGGQEHFLRETDQLLDFVRGCQTADGIAGITLPGDPERSHQQHGREHGVEYEPQNWDALLQLAAKMQVPDPPTPLD